jgi:hypothetical protein
MVATCGRGVSNGHAPYLLPEFALHAEPAPALHVFKKGAKAIIQELVNSDAIDKMTDKLNVKIISKYNAC